jgi:hypothetical protein
MNIQYFPTVEICDVVPKTIVPTCDDDWVDLSDVDIGPEHKLDDKSGLQ